ncbi:MAG: glycosyltransferase family 2 protein [Ruminiclostridium sp.]
MRKIKVTIYTQAFNTEKYLRACIESVLNQTYTDFEYFLIDNGSVDGTRNIIEEYSKNDKRIVPVYINENTVGLFAQNKHKFKGEYSTILDSDDWIEPTYLERLVTLAEETKSDIVTTGTVMHVEDTGEKFYRQIDKKFILEKQDFAGGFPLYHAFFRTMWGKLVKTEIVEKTHIMTARETGIIYGGDTIAAFAWLRNSNRICLDSSLLHHYRIHSKSMSKKYDSRQSFSDVYLFNDAVSFLSDYGEISPGNMEFLHIVYANAVNDTLENIINSTLTADEKLSEYRKISERQLTKDAFKVNYKDVNNCRVRLITAAVKCAAELTEETENFPTILSSLLPNCSNAVSTANAGLFIAVENLRKPLVDDDKGGLLKELLKLISENRYVKQYNIPEMVHKLTCGNQLLSRISDVKLLRKHGDIYLYVWNKEYEKALSKMTEHLLSGKREGEDYLQLYLSLSALLERADEFVFGKIKIAEFYFSKKRYDECRTAIADLSDMCIEDTPEIARIKEQLNIQ